MLRGRPVIRIEYISLRWKIALATLFTLSMLMVGFVFGMVVALTDPEPNVAVIEDKLSLPTPQSSPRAFNGTNISTMIGQWNPEDYNAEVECLAQNIYFEAKSESRIGQIAVGLVTINRVLSKRYPNTVCDVVWQKAKHPKTGEWVAQFSWTWDGKNDQPKNMKAWEKAVRIAQAMTAGRSLHNVSDFTDGSTHYHADYVSPYWRKHFTPTLTIGTHIFYRDEGATPTPHPDSIETVAMNDDGEL